MSEDNFHLHLTQTQEEEQSCFLVEDSQEGSESFTQSQPSAGRLLSALPALSRSAEMGLEEREKDQPTPEEGHDEADAGVNDPEEEDDDEGSNQSQQDFPPLVLADSAAASSSLSLIPASVSHMNAENIIPSSINPTNHCDSEPGYSDASTAVVGRGSSPAASVSDHSEVNQAKSSTSAISSLSSVSESEVQVVTPRRKRGQRQLTDNKSVKRRKPNTSDNKSTETDTSSDREIPTRSRVAGLITSPSKKIGILSLSGQPTTVPDSIPDSQMSGVVPSSQAEVPYLIPSSPSELPPGNEAVTQDFMLQMSVSQNQCTMEDVSEKRSSKSLSSEEKTSVSSGSGDAEGILDALQHDTLENTPTPHHRTVIENPKVGNFRLEKPPLPEHFDKVDENSEKSIFKSARQKVMSPKKTASTSSESVEKQTPSDPFDDICLDKNKNECLTTPSKGIATGSHGIDFTTEDAQVPGCSKELAVSELSLTKAKKSVTRLRDRETPKSRMAGGKRVRTLLEMKSQASSSSDEKMNDPYYFKSTQSQQKKAQPVVTLGERSIHTTKITTVLSRVMIVVEERVDGTAVNTRVDQREEVISTDIITNDEVVTPSLSSASTSMTSGDLGDISSIERSSGSKTASSGEAVNTVILQHSAVSKDSVPGTPSITKIPSPPDDDPTTFVKPAIPRKRSSVGSPDKSKSSKSTESFRRSSSLFSTFSENVSPENQSKSSKSTDSAHRSASLFSTFSEHDLLPAGESHNETVIEKEKHDEKSTVDLNLSNIEVALPRLATGHLAEGTNVFAMWKNKSFYPGKIKSNLTRDRYTVQYEDGAVKQVKAADLIICNLLRKGHDLMMEYEGDWVLRATVVGHEKLESGEIVHVVERKTPDGDTKRHEVPRHQVSLSADQSAALKAAIKESSADFVQETPTQTSEPPQPSGKEIIPQSLPFLPTQVLKIGESVFARWRGRNFYPGTISVSHPDRLYTVAFADGTVREVHEHDLIVCSMLPAGQNVMVLTGAEWAEEAVILGYCAAKLGRGYQVQFQDSSQREISCEDVYLSKDQATSLIADIKPAIRTVFDDVSLDNLVDGKRKRVATPATPKSTKKRNPSTRKKGQKATDPKATSTPSGAEILKKSVDDDNKATPYASPKPMGKFKSRTQLFSDGRGNAANSTLFAGMVFLLSHVDKSEEQIKEEKAMMAADVSANADESSSINEGETIAYDKDQLYQQLTAGGGKVLDNFDLHEAMSADLCLLISDSHQRSLKYFYSLAGGVPCVSHVWVRDCCKMEKRLPYHSYVLPAGISLTRQRLIEWHSRHNVLRLLKVCVSSKNKKYVETWSSVLEVAGCVVKDASMTFEPGVVNFVLADASIASHVKSSAIDLGIPIVSSEWVIQCLINGQRLPYDAHEKFQHDYNED